MASRKLETLLVLGVLLSAGAALILAETIPGLKNSSSITFRLSAKNLPTMDPFGGNPDPYVIITYENPPNPELKLGETSKLSDTQNPEWPETFNVIQYNGSSQRLKLDLWDEDVDADDYMGAVEIRLEEILSTFGGVLERNVILNNSTVNTGKLILTANITNAVQN